MRKLALEKVKTDDTVDGQNPANHQGWWENPMIYRVLTIPGGCLGFLNHQQYQWGANSTIKKQGEGKSCKHFSQKKNGTFWATICCLLVFDTCKPGTLEGCNYHVPRMDCYIRWKTATWTKGNVGRYSPHGAFAVCNKNYLWGDDGDVLSPKILSHYLWTVSRMSVFVEWIVVKVESWRNTPCFIISPPNSGAVLFI